MTGPDGAAELSYPPALIDNYLSVTRRRPRGALSATALRTRQPAARHLLTRLPGGPAASLAQVLAAARTANGGQDRVSAGQTSATLLAELARVVALQNVDATDVEDGLALYDLALELFGPDQIPADHQGIHAQLAFHRGDRARAAALRSLYRRAPEYVRADLGLDLANPHAGGAAPGSDWLTSFQRLFPDPAPTIGPDGPTPFDRVTVAINTLIDATEKVSVIVTAYRPGVDLVTAVRSVLMQSWANLEVLIVDDASPPEYGAILQRCLDLDDRVVLLRLEENRGTYVARNIGIDAARGEFVTFQDSDDWSHPRRIERQIEPLLSDQSLVATVSDALRIGDDLVLTTPGRNPRIMNTSSVAFRRNAVLARIGYFDNVRKAADSEFLKRMEAAFGADAVWRVRGETYALVRQSPNSLSRAEIRAGWMDPSRVAYRSAYELWHEEIKSGKAGAFLARSPGPRPFPAPGRLQVTDTTPALVRYDVVVVGDWRFIGGTQMSALDEIRALIGQGLRVGVVQLESFHHMTPYRKSVCRPLQRLINAGTVHQVLLSDQVEAALLIVRQPAVLDFAAGLVSNLRAGRVVIVGATAPSGVDGTDHRYSPHACTDAAHSLFGVEPEWCPQGPRVRGALTGVRLTPFDLPGTVDTERLRVRRTALRSDVPVIGRMARDIWMRWPADRRTLMQAYPDAADTDVRILGGAETARRVLGSALPVNWLVYERDEVSVRSFLYQIDFFVYFGHPNVVEEGPRPVLEALAAGCAVILSNASSAAFGNAAIYAEAADVQDIVRDYHADPGAFLEQSGCAQTWAEERIGQTAYLKQIMTIR